MCALCVAVIVFFVSCYRWHCYYNHRGVPVVSVGVIVTVVCVVSLFIAFVVVIVDVFAVVVCCCW